MMLAQDPESRIENFKYKQPNGADIYSTEKITSTQY